MPKIEQVPTDKCRPNERELERHKDPVATLQLGENMKARGQLQPIGLTEDFEIIYGTGRWKAAMAAGIKALDAKIHVGPMSELDKMLARLAENLHRKNYTGHEQFVRISELAAMTKMQGKELAGSLNCDPSWVSRVLSVSKLRSEWQEALREEKVTISDCSEASKLSHDDQMVLLESKLSGRAIGREGTKSEARKLHNATKNGGSAPAVRVPSLKIALADGVQVVIKGEVDLDSSIDALKDAIKAITKARDTGLNAATAMKVWAEMAKAGA